jgi:hypothetical protein
VNLIRREKQKDNLAKFCWDMAKITLGAMVIAPIAKPEPMAAWVMAAGVATTVAFGVLAYVIDGMEIRT